jgi:tetrahydromethanopterin S-methyltransferase subunit A
VTSVRKKLEDAAGALCEAFLPIKQQYYFGSGKSNAICTLSSTNLLESISRSSLMEKVLIAGRLLSENRGIDAIINFAMNYPELRLIIVCGKEVKGHRAGQALIALAQNGVNSNGRIIGASGPNPLITQSHTNVEIFRNQVQIIDLIGKVDVAEISRVLVA